MSLYLTKNRVTVNCKFFNQISLWYNEFEQNNIQMGKDGNIENNKTYKFSALEDPHSFFVTMGVAIIAIVLAGYSIGSRVIEDPILVASIVVTIGLGLLFVNFALSRGLEKISEANRLKSEFIKVVSHQLRAPVSNCQWVAEFLLSGRTGDLGKKQRKYLEILRENTDRVQELISELLTVSKIEGGNLNFNKTFFSLEKLAKEVVSKSEPLANASNVKVSVKNEQNLPKVLADISKIKIVLENLVDNAVRYTSLSDEKRKSKVDVFLYKKNSHIVFKIEDNGIGISKDDEKYIFQKFFRGKETMKYRTQGTGLGLYISKSIIEKMGGKIWFESEFRKGSTFYFTLPTK